MRCRNRFNTTVRPTSPIEIAAIRQECFERKRAKRAKLFEGLQVSPSVIRGDQIPNSQAEAAFKARAMEKGWKPHRPSWPDFLVETLEGMIAVEVKGRNDIVSTTQAETFRLLEACGIKVFVWRMAKGCTHKLVRWHNGDGLIKIGLRQAA